MTMEEHEQHLKLTLQVLRQHHLYAKFRKCEFLVRSVPFLGHVVLDNGVEVDPSNTKVVNNWPNLLLLQIFVASWGWLVIIAGSWRVFISFLPTHTFDKEESQVLMGRYL